MSNSQDIEKRIIKAFFYSNKQDRLIYELSSGRSDKLIHRLSDNPEQYIKVNCMIDKKTKGRSNEEILTVLKANGVSNKCYVLSEYSNFSMRECDLTEAIEKLNMNNFAFLIVGLPSGYSFFQGESHASNQPNCFLKPEIKF